MYALLKAFSIFTLTMEFYDSPFGYTDNFLQAVVGSSFMGAIAFVKTLSELQLIRSCYLINNQSTKDSFQQDYLSHVYTHIHVLLTSLLTPVICGSFLETFSTMSITAGSNLELQTASYLGFVALSYCAQILAKNKEGFELVYEPILEFLESWAFFHASFLRIVTHQESIDTSMFYYYYSNDPLYFAALLAPVRVLYLFYQWSASKLPDEVKHALKGHSSEKERCILTTTQQTYVAKHFPLIANNDEYQLLIQTTDSSATNETSYKKYDLSRLKKNEVTAILLHSIMGGHHIYELITFFTTHPKPSKTSPISATHPVITKASDAATAANQACHDATAYAHQGSVQSAIQSAQESIKAFNEATKLIVMAANTYRHAYKKVEIG